MCKGIKEDTVEKIYHSLTREEVRAQPSADRKGTTQGQSPGKELSIGAEIS